MEVLHSHKDSVMAVLEAFVYDPLLNWRLMDSKIFTNNNKRLMLKLKLKTHLFLVIISATKGDKRSKQRTSGSYSSSGQEQGGSFCKINTEIAT